MIYLSTKAREEPKRATRANPGGMASAQPPKVDWPLVEFGVGLLVTLVAAALTHKLWRLLCLVAAYLISIGVVCQLAPLVPVSRRELLIILASVTVLVAAFAFGPVRRWLLRRDAPAQGDDVNTLKQTVARQIDEVYQANRARDDARTERDAQKVETASLKAQVEHMQGEIRALHRTMADMLPKEDKQKLLTEIRIAREQRDDLRRERDAARAQLAFPKFQAGILEVVFADAQGPDLYAAVVVQIINDGADSIARAFRFSACTVYGSTIVTEILSPPAFPLVVNHGTGLINYLEEHYIMTRTRMSPVRRGVPVTGIIPVVFRGIVDIKEVDLRTLQFKFTDGTGTPDGLKWWESTTMTPGELTDIISQRKYVGLPSVQPYGTS
jgi:FtsZ-binding cell division protein ZapB